MTMAGTSWPDRATPQIEIDPDSAPLTSEDFRRLSAVELSLSRGLAIKAWWDRKNEGLPTPHHDEYEQSLLARSRFDDSFPLMRFSQSWPHDISYGFSDRIEQDGLDLGVIGCFQQFFYDQPTLRLQEVLSRVKGVSSEVIDRANVQALKNWCDNVREFVLGTFIKATSLVRPYPDDNGKRSPLASYLKRFNWCPEGEGTRTGMRHSQLYYKRLGTGCVGKFWPVQYRGINLRDIGAKYAWIVIEDEVSGYDLEFRLDNETPYVGVPVMEKQFGVISPELVLDEMPSEGLMGRFGFGYALLEQSDTGNSDDLRPPYDIGLQQTEFLLEENGEILVQNYLIAERPQRVSLLKLNPAGQGLSALDRMSLGMFSSALKPFAEVVGKLPLVGQFDPILTYVDLANAVTGGFAGKELCIGNELLERRILYNHYLKQFEMVIGTRGIWRNCRDWTTETPAHRH